MNGFKFGLPGEKFSDALCAQGLRAHAIWESLQAAHGEPAFKWRRHSTGFTLDVLGVFIKCAFIAEDKRATQDVTMAREVFCHRVHHNVSAEFERTAQQWRGPRVVANDHGAGFLCDGDD